MRGTKAGNNYLGLVKEYDLFVPLYYNDGSPIEALSSSNCTRVYSITSAASHSFPNPMKDIGNLLV